MFFLLIPVPVQVKTDLLHVYTNDVEDASPLELRSFNVELLQKKINDLEEENKNLHDEASQVSSLFIRVILTNHNSWSSLCSWRTKRQSARRKKRSSLRTRCNTWLRPIFKLRTFIINLPTRWDYPAGSQHLVEARKRIAENSQMSDICEFSPHCSHDTIHVVSGFQLMMNEGSRNSDGDWDWWRFI